MLEIDTTELKGKRFKCIDGCGLCCLCQPELLPPEQKVFRLDAKLSKSVVKSDFDPSKRSIAMVSNGGPCSLLKERKCTIYTLRPHFCRQFPVHTHLMWRIQLTPDYSCRGIWRDDWDVQADDFVDLEKYGMDEIGTYGRERLEREVAESFEVFDEFRTEARDAGAWVDVDSLRASASSLIDKGYFSSLKGLGSILKAVESAREHGLEVHESLQAVSSESAVRSAFGAIKELSEEVLTIEEIEDSPIYVDSGLNWNIYALDKGRIWKKRLRDTGGADTVEAVELKHEEININSTGESSLARYANVTNARDTFLGFVYYLVDDADYETKILPTYLENLAMTQLDLVFRSALVQPQTLRSIGGTQVAEGLVYIDMDMHDAPTIGSVI